MGEKKKKELSTKCYEVVMHNHERERHGQVLGAWEDILSKIETSENEKVNDKKASGVLTLLHLNSLS